MQWDNAESFYGNARQPPELKHYGVKGQKWGIRRYQEENGSYTEEGKIRYGRKSKSSLGELQSRGKATKGLTRGTETDKTKDKKPPKDYSKEERKDWKAKDASKLSDEELRRRNNRLQAEQNYKNNATPEWKKTAKSWGKEAVHAFIFAVVGVGTAVLTTVLKSKLPANLKEKTKHTIKAAAKTKINDIKG